VNDSRAIQRSRILDLLIAARGEWVPLPKIADIAAQYNARIYELRRLGFRIKNRTQDLNGTRHSWFRLEPGLIPPTSTRDVHAIPTLPAAQSALFKNDMPPRWIDPEEQTAQR
jgi:hypothetical protein